MNSDTRHDFAGVMTALVTPMQRGTGQVDERALAELCEAQLRAGVHGLVPCGSTGEAATLADAEQERVVRVVVEAVAGRVPVIAGAGSNSTARAVELGRAARRAGAQALLAVTPYYNRPTQDGLYRHFKELAALDLPVILYNVPARTGSDLLPDTVARLCDLPAVVALKEASGTVQRTQQVLAKVGDRLALLSGEDALNFPLYCVGARGCISVVSNVAPELTVQIWEATRAGDLGRARKLHYDFLPLADSMFIESNPIPVKTALHLMGRMEAELRAPLHPMTGPNRERLRATLVEYGLV